METLCNLDVVCTDGGCRRLQPDERLEPSMGLDVGTGDRRQAPSVFGSDELSQEVTNFLVPSSAWRFDAFFSSAIRHLEPVL